MRNAVPMKPKGKVPAPPESLSPAAVAEWRRLAPKLVKRGVLTAETLALFVTYCQSFATWQEAQQHPATQTTVAKSGNEWTAPSAWFVVGTRAFAAMARAATLLGLSEAGLRRRSKRATRKPSDDKFLNLLHPRIAE